MWRIIWNALLILTVASLTGCAGTSFALLDRTTPTPGGQEIGDPYIPQLGNTGYDVQQYELRYTLNPIKIFINGETTIHAVSTFDNLGQISLDFAGFEIQTLTVDKKEAAYVRDGNELIITLPKLLKKGQAFSVDVVFSGKPPEPPADTWFTSEYGFRYEPGYKTIYTLAEPGGAQYWFPSNDHPRDKATFRFVLTVPDGYQGVANGNLVKTEQDIPNAIAEGEVGDRFTWESDDPIATYLAVVAVGKYEMVEGATPKGIPLRSYVYPVDEYAYNNQMKTLKVGEALDWFSEKLGPYPFDAFGFVNVANPQLGMETQSMVLLSRSLMMNSPDVFVHELVHMWFGDWVSLDSWAEIWRNEGFATYLTALWEDQVKPGTLEKRLAEWRTFLESQPPNYDLNQPPLPAMFDAPSYLEGALLVHDLRTEMGDEAFFAGLRAYFEKYGGKTATDEQFIAEMETAAGKQLDDVFERWFAGGLPEN